MHKSVYRTIYYFLLFIVANVFGALIACSPTKFKSYDSTPEEAAVRNSSNCPEISTGVYKCTDTFKVGSGKVDILFVDDNSASMSSVHKKIAAKFGGFIENLDSKEIDYRISVTTTDLAVMQQNSMVTFSNGSKVLTKSDSNRVSLFNAGISRVETISCENFIKSAFYTYGSGFNSTSYYTQNYYTQCPSGDERGIFTAYEAVSKNSSSLIRSDAHLNIILVSNEDVRSGSYNVDSRYALESKDTASNFTAMMNANYPGKYWEFNSIIVKDNSCAAIQQSEFVDNTNTPIRDASGNFVIGANVGLEYAALSASASTDIDGNPAPRGQILSICNDDYSGYFNNIAAKISQSARLMPLKCNPTTAPVVTRSNNPSLSVPYQWQGNKILFQAGSEGIPVSVSYQCQISTAH